MAASTTRRKKFDGPTPEEAIVRNLIEILVKGVTPWCKPWDGRGGDVHINFLTSRPR
jgi:antirestriction protein ArdC